MILDCSKYVGPCRCGREHTLETKKVVVEYHALDKFDQYMDEVGLTGKRAVIYDTNTYNLPTLRHVRADQEIVLNAEGLHSEKGMIEDMMRQLDHPDVIVAVGSGTIMDFGRYPAYHLGIPFVAVPTLASSDGFTANICSIIIDGQKKSIPMQAAALVVCDLNVVSAAPYVARMVESAAKEVDAGVIEAAQSMGASTFRIIWKVIIPEAKPALITGAVISTVTILGYSAMAGTIGGGGLGQIAITYGYQKYDDQIVWLCVALTIIIVQILQEFGMYIARRTDRRART